MLVEIWLECGVRLTQRWDASDQIWEGGAREAQGPPHASIYGFSIILNQEFSKCISGLLGKLIRGSLMRRTTEAFIKHSLGIASARRFCKTVFAQDEDGWPDPHKC